VTWSAPMTAVANSTFTAAQFNQYVRDNLNETAPAKATSAGSYFVADGVNSIAERTPNGVGILPSDRRSPSPQARTPSSSPTAR
jgi:hypothetical protein